MNIDWTSLANLGFPIVFGFFVLWSISKYGPDFIKAWQAFAVAIHDLGESVDKNTEVTKRQYEESMSAKDQLKSLNEKLNKRDERFNKLDGDYVEIRQILGEIDRKLKEFCE